jgi:hypothetical protein
MVERCSFTNRHVKRCLIRTFKNDVSFFEPPGSKSSTVYFLRSAVDKVPSETVTDLENLWCRGKKVDFEAGL